MSTTGFGLKRTVFPAQVASVTSTGSTTPRRTSVPRESGETERFGVTTHPSALRCFGGRERTAARPLTSVSKSTRNVHHRLRLEKDSLSSAGCFGNKHRIDNPSRNFGSERIGRDRTLRRDDSPKSESLRANGFELSRNHFGDDATFTAVRRFD